MEKFKKCELFLILFKYFYRNKEKLILKQENIPKPDLGKYKYKTFNKFYFFNKIFNSL